jgi:signal transduction histidine kinase
MTRPIHIWIIFGVCLAVLLAAMGWASLTVLRLERFEAQAQQKAELEERMRLALWRMDSFLTPLIVEESARPYYAYYPFHTAEQAYTKMYRSIREEVLIPSPLLAFASSNVLLHFQFDLDGNITSPQVPQGNERDLAESAYANRQSIETAAARLNELQQVLNHRAETLAAVMPRQLDPGAAPVAIPPSLSNRDLLANLCALHPTNAVPLIQLAPIPAPAPSSRFAQRLDALFVPETIPSPEPPPIPVQKTQREQSPAGLQQRMSQKSEIVSVENQMLKNSLEWNARANVYQQAAALNVDKATQFTLPPRLNLSEGPIRAVWIGSTLVLARRVALDDKMFVQGCWLNWTHLKQSLLATIEDLFPVAELEPIATANGDKEAHMLAFLPVKITVPPLSFAALPFWTPIRVSLAVAGLCVLLAALAAGMLLHGAVSLSERRGAFVSAVTHELRTPLTTFKMYSEMLAEGMVQEPEQRRHYLNTLCSEANRLSHLVENVLAYARLERGSARTRIEKVTLAELIERVKPRLLHRAEQAALRLDVDSDEPALATVVHVDVAAVEQILFNLVDNASKYAAPTATEKVIHLEALPNGKFAMLRVRDHGRGITREAARRLFRPFSKSAHEAAHSAPGVGLGLALCRRLSRSLGGDLRLDDLGRDGACFVLLLPISIPKSSTGASIS